MQHKDTVDSDHIIMYVNNELNTSNVCTCTCVRNTKIIRALTALLRGWIVGSSLRPVVATTSGPHLP